VFNTWEPRSNLSCEKLVTQFLQSDKRQSWQAEVAAANEPEAKKRKISELVDQMLRFEPNLTALGLIDMYLELDVSKVGYRLRRLLFRILLGRLLRVDLMHGSQKCSVRPSVHPRKVSSISMKFGV